MNRKLASAMFFAGLVLIALLILARSQRRGEFAPFKPTQDEAATQPEASLGQSASEKLASKPGATGASEFRLSIAAQNEVQRCLGSSAVHLEGVVALLTQKHAQQGARRELHWENLHFQLPDGTPRRLRLETEATADGKERIRVSLYGEDAEGLPVPLELPRELKAKRERGVDEYLETQRAHAPHFRERALHLRFGSGDAGSGVELIEENGSARSLHYAADGLSLSCDPVEQGALAIDCHCER